MAGVVSARAGVIVTAVLGIIVVTLTDYIVAAMADVVADLAGIVSCSSLHSCCVAPFEISNSCIFFYSQKIEIHSGTAY